MRRIATILLLLTALVSCSKIDIFTGISGQEGGREGGSATKTGGDTEEIRNVMILYSAGFNSLASYLDENIEDLQKGDIPAYRTGYDDVLLVYSRLTPRSSSSGRCISVYSTPTESALFHIYKKGEEIVRDTLKVWGKEVDACNPETMREVLQMAHDRFPAKSYGMVFSSHASGWLPSGYYSNPDNFENVTVWSAPARMRRVQGTFPAIESFPAVKSMGQDNNPDNSVEMEIDVFAEAIPYRLDYLIIDACLAGCVEIAYELRGKADIVGYSQAEVLAGGFNYQGMTSKLLQETPDPIGVCRDYFNRYDSQSGVYRSATISVIDTRKMDSLASVCKSLFEKYRSTISTMNGSPVQGYFRYNRHFFYDLEDVLIQAGIDEDEKEQLSAALRECVLYNAATEYFISIKINTACGFSMYLPSMGSSFLDNFYTTHVAWNKATELVKE